MTDAKKPVTFFGEAWTTLIIAVPMIFGQIGQILLSIIDTKMVAYISVEAVAGVAFGGVIMLFFMIIAMGLCTPVYVLVGKARGPDRLDQAASALKYGLWIVTAYSILIALFFTCFPQVFDYFGQPPEVVEAGRTYSIFMAWSIWPALLLRCMRNHSEALGDVWGPFWVTMAFVSLNVIFNYIFIFGKFGAPAMGAAGAGLGTLLARFAGFFIQVWLSYATPRFGLMRNVKRFFIVKWNRIYSYLAVGIPTMIQIVFEYGFFATGVILMGQLGTEQLAMHQIMTQYTTTTFMIPLSISFAITMRVADAVGDNDWDRARRIGFSGTTISLIIMSGIGMLSLIFGHLIAPAFVDNPTVIQMAANILLLLALVQAFDGIQVVAMAALRGIPDAWIPLGLVVIGYWVVGIPFAYYMAFHTPMNYKGIWAGYLTGLTFSGFFVVLRFHIYTLRKRAQSL